MIMVTHVQTLDEAACISHSTNTLAKSINSLITTSFYGLKRR